MGNCCCGDIDNTYHGPIRSTRSSSSSWNGITTPPAFNPSNDRTPLLSNSASDRASIRAKPSTYRASIRPTAVTDNTIRTPGYGVTSSITNRERSSTSRDNNKTLPSSNIYPIRSTRSSSSSSTVITAPPALNLFNDKAQIPSKSASDRASIRALPSIYRAPVRPKVVTDNSTRTLGYGATSSKTNWERSGTSRDNNKTLVSPRGHSSSYRTINQPSRINTNRKKPVPVKANPEILSKSSTLYKFNKKTDNVFQLEILREESFEYQRIESKFLRFNKSFFKLHSIEKVHNPYLLLQYRLKKDEYYRKGIRYRERLLFHGTKKTNIEDICETNFDWRLQGTAFGSRFGQGVNFASEAYFSTHYCDDGYNKVMIIANVLIGNSCRGNSDMAIPPINFDTSTNGKKNVYVKYDDNTFYPVYLIHFGGIDYKKKNRRNVSERDSDCTSDRGSDCTSDLTLTVLLTLTLTVTLTDSDSDSD